MRLVLIFLFVLTAYSCVTYNRMLRTPDIDKRFNYGVKLYEEQKYYKALPFFEGLYRDTYATDKSEEIMYYLANCYYGMGNYSLAASQFLEYNTTYPDSKNAEKTLFLSAYCYYLESPEFNKSSEKTIAAIEQLQNFANKYPLSDSLPRVNDLIDKLNQKLEKKQFNIAQFYLDIEDYKASAYAFRVVLDLFPETTSREKILFNIAKSDLALSIYSSEDKKKSRVNVAISSYKKFKKKYPDSKKIKELDNLYSKLKIND